MTEEYVVRGRRVVTPEGERPAAVHVRRGTVVGVTDPADAPPLPVVDAGDDVVLPGLVDTHVHVNDPGRADWEGFTTATRAAAAGGVTTLVDMPLNAIPPTTSLEGLAAKIQALEAQVHVDVGLCGGLVPESVDGLADLSREGVLAFKCFLAETGVAEFRHVHERELAAGMRSLARVGAPLLVHAELEGPLDAAAAEAAARDPRRYATYLASRPKTAEDAAVDLVLRLAKETTARAHVVHLSSSSALDLVRRAKEGRVPLTVETCPHYLTFASEEIPDGATAFKCAPPIREADNREALWRALREGVVDQVVTDHSPSTAALKCSGSGDFMKAWGGISSLQLGLAAVWTGARARGASLVDVVRWMCEAPARLVGVYGKKGVLAPGADADLVFFAPDARFTASAASLEHKNKITAYEGRELTGVVTRTVLRGETIYERGPAGATWGPRRGRWLRRAA